MTSGLHVMGTALLIAGLSAHAIAQEAESETVTEETVAEVERVPDTANLMGLNKITARTHPMRVKLDTPLRFGTLGIVVRACEKARPEDPPKTIAFLEVREYPVNEEITTEPEPIFSGWMLASSPGLNALEHPVYDVWLTDCTISSAAAPASSE
ncbi:DUF2155 domain-containing protein [Candidatus Phaeomarinobacter ectocarpi]|uniref:DUF2155 domain-containing protein n=1 Tax=Candidatus Phaeomarinibacter ectocarpi TaxID=1458461 RepID=UPI0005C59B29|nr:DUF2155 domain-containing protein [Candidatus Phaeomarinobacter ectocarpi]